LAGPLALSTADRVNVELPNDLSRGGRVRLGERTEVESGRVDGCRATVPLDDVQSEVQRDEDRAGEQEGIEQDQGRPDIACADRGETTRDRLPSLHRTTSSE